MVIKHNEPLKAHTTFRMGGTAARMYIPETMEELKAILRQEPEARLIGGGSNLLINDKKIFQAVIDLGKFNDLIEDLGQGRYKVGASLRLQKLIQRINEDGYGGIEYLYSVPGLVGGAICMNAGRGRQFQQSISDYLQRVHILEKGESRWIEKEECGFTYRNSIFKNSDCVILEAVFCFTEQSYEESYRLRKERMELVRRVQDPSKPNFGTVFMEADPVIMKGIRFMGIKKGGVSFSKKTANWLLNNGGTYQDTVFLLKLVKKLHAAAGKKCCQEVICWD